jgi:hypothetical protein
MKRLFWKWLGIGLCALGLFPVRGGASERLCASGMELGRGDLDSRLMRGRRDGYWLVEQRMRLCGAQGGGCSTWSTASRFVELLARDRKRRSWVRFGLSDQAEVRSEDGVRGDELFALGSGREGGLVRFRVGRLQTHPLVQDYVYSLPSGPGLPTEEYSVTIWKVRRGHALPFELSEDRRQVCVLLQ